MKKIEKRLSFFEQFCITFFLMKMITFILASSNTYCSVNMTAHWKLLTFMIGGNDFCSDICYQTNATQWMNESQEKYLIKTLRFIRDNMPR